MSAIRYNDNVDASILRQRVHACRIMIHAMDHQFEEDVGENHATINFLLGSRRIVQADMKVVDEHGLGALEISFLLDSLPTPAVKSTDVKARGCADGFDADQPVPSSSAWPTVEDFIHALERRGLHHFRFIHVGGAADGSRFWVWTVMSMFARCGLLDTAQALRNADPIPLWTLLNHKWDRSQDARPWAAVPGAFLPRESAMLVRSRDDVRRALPLHEQAALRCLRTAVAKARDCQLALGRFDRDAHSRAVDRFMESSTMLLDRDWMISAALQCEPEICDHLQAALRSRYRRAANVIAAAMETPKHDHTVFILLLAAVIEISGSPDADVGEEEEEEIVISNRRDNRHDGWTLASAALHAYGSLVQSGRTPSASSGIVIAEIARRLGISHEAAQRRWQMWSGERRPDE